ncbi:MFS transporter [Clostridium thermarum]|uniref:MFS transporter n=1 Tax=Clostridium thermarum TaxID=1716543 RepID=UPI0013D4AFFD|nr:MFS transporter [Clostridium thermarum]
MLKGYKEYFHLPKAVYFLVAAKTINGLGNFIMPLLTLILTEKIGLSSSQAGFYILILNISFVPGLLLGGRLVDTFGRKKVIVIFHSLAAIIFLNCGFINPSMLIVYLLILGSAMLAASLPAYDALIADLTNSHTRKRAFSLMFMGHNLGFSIAPVLGGFLFKNYLYLVFIIDAITTLISVLLVLFFIPDIRHHQEQHKSKKEHGEDKKKLNVVEFLLSRPVVLVFAGLLFFYNFSYSQWAFTLPIHMVALFPEEGPKYYGMLEGMNGLLILLFTPVITKFTLKTMPTKVIATGGLFYAVSFAILIVTRLLPMFFVVVIIMTIGEMMVTVNNNTFISSVTPPQYRGRVSAIFQIIYGAGFAAGPFIMGKALDYITTNDVWVIITAVIGTAALLLFVLSRRLKKKGIENHY